MIKCSMKVVESLKTYMVMSKVDDISNHKVMVISGQVRL